MDPVIFTQRMPLSKFKEERPKEYASLLKSGKLEELLVAPPKKWFSKTVLAVGLTFLAIGVLIVIAIIYSLIASL
jgi:preprotein translocase subunit Sss1